MADRVIDCCWECDWAKEDPSTQYRCGQSGNALIPDMDHVPDFCILRSEAILIRLKNGPREY